LTYLVSGVIAIVRSAAAAAGTGSPSSSSGVAAIEDNAESDSVNATTVGISDFVFMMFSSKKEGMVQPANL
jgi:hypothetical protein